MVVEAGYQLNIFLNLAKESKTPFRISSPISITLVCLSRTSTICFLDCSDGI